MTEQLHSSWKQRASKGIKDRLTGSESLRASGTAAVLIGVRFLGTLGTFAYTVVMARMLRNV